MSTTYTTSGEPRTTTEPSAPRGSGRVFWHPTPNGWGGTLPGNETATLVVTTNLEDATCRQNVQVVLNESDLHGGDYALPALAYFPESGLAYDGTVEVTGISHVPNTGNVVSFVVSGDAAMRAVLWRVVEENLVLVGEFEGPFLPSQTHTVTHSDPATGPNTYVVAVGIEPNGYFSDEISITN
jgi:hypothetical protein